MEPLYPKPVIRFLELLWGDGWLSPGGPDEVARLLDGVDLAGKHVLDIGCGAGGIDCLLAEAYGASRLTGIDVEAAVLATAADRVSARGLHDRIELLEVEPGPLPFGDAAFDVVFSKDSIVHIADKHALAREIFRVLRPGGRFVASDWLTSHDGQPSPAMRAYLASEDLDFGMASPDTYRDALHQAGFSDIELEDRNPWYRQQARRELALLRGDLRQPAIEAMGRDLFDHNVRTWTLMIEVLDTGEHCPHHLRARKP